MVIDKTSRIWSCLLVLSSDTVIGCEHANQQYPVLKIKYMCLSVNVHTFFTSYAFEFVFAYGIY